MYLSLFKKNQHLPIHLLQTLNFFSPIGIPLQIALCCKCRKTRCSTSMIHVISLFLCFIPNNPHQQAGEDLSEYSRISTDVSQPDGKPK
jgi:hypothetical protein